jgi:hypothetical protein
MSSAYVKYQSFAGTLGGKIVDILGTAGSTADTLKVALTNTAPNVATNTVLADITEITAHNGYSAGGASATNVGTASGGTLTVVGTDIVFTASGGTIGPLQYAVLYDSTASGGPLIAYWDYGSSITLQDGDTFTVDFSTSLFTLA